MMAGQCIVPFAGWSRLILSHRCHIRRISIRCCLHPLRCLPLCPIRPHHPLRKLCHRLLPGHADVLFKGNEEPSIITELNPNRIALAQVSKLCDPDVRLPEQMLYALHPENEPSCRLGIELDFRQLQDNRRASSSAACIAPNTFLNSGNWMRLLHTVQFLYIGSKMF